MEGMNMGSLLDYDDVTMGVADGCSRFRQHQDNAFEAAGYVENAEAYPVSAHGTNFQGDPSYPKNALAYSTYHGLVDVTAGGGFAENYSNPSLPATASLHLQMQFINEAVAGFSGDNVEEHFLQGTAREFTTFDTDNLSLGTTTSPGVGSPNSTSPDPENVAKLKKPRRQPGSGAVPCRIEDCTKTFQDERSEERHYQSTHKDLSQDPPSQHVCRCNAEFPRVRSDTFRRHLENQRSCRPKWCNSTFCCPFCPDGGNIADLEAIKHHLSSAHKGKRGRPRGSKNKPRN